MTPRQVIHGLGQRFEEQSDAYQSGAYNEAQLRQEFIDQLVYELYELTEDEIKIVEAASAPAPARQEDAAE